MFCKHQIKVIVQHIEPMTSYHSYEIKLSEGQLEKLARAYKNNSVITIQLTKNELSGPHELFLTKTQLKKIKKAMKSGVQCSRADIKISKTQIRKAVKYGG